MNVKSPHLLSSKWHASGNYPCCTTDKKKVLTYHSIATWVSPHKLTWESERQHREVNSLSDHPYGSADCDEQLTWRKSLTHSSLTGDERCRSRSHMTGIICRHPSHAAGPCLSRRSVSDRRPRIAGIFCKNADSYRIFLVFMTAMMLVFYILLE